MPEETVISLPPPHTTGGISVEQALLRRRSIREYRRDPLVLAEVSQLLWAAQGITDPAGYRTAPSAGAFHPLELHLVAGQVSDLPAGIYRYRPAGHQLSLTAAGDHRAELSHAALDQSCVRVAPAVLVFGAIDDRAAAKYGRRTAMYVHLEAGHAAQNILLQAFSLRLGAVPIAAFDDLRIKQVVGMLEKERPVYLIPVGRV